MQRLCALLLLVLLSAPIVAPAPAEAAPRSLSAEDVYALGLKYLRRGYFTKALEQFNRVRTFYRDDPYSLKAELAIADIHFKKNEWDEARLAYEDFMRAHPRYPELDLVVYRLGLVIYKKSPIIPDRDQTWTKQTVSVWAGFGARFPESEHRPEVDKYLGKAQGRLAEKELIIAQFYARRNSWPSVVGRTEGLLRAWPTSPDRGEALALYGVAQHQLGNTDAANTALLQIDADPALSRWSRPTAPFRTQATCLAGLRNRCSGSEALASRPTVSSQPASFVTSASRTDFGNSGCSTMKLDRSVGLLSTLRKCWATGVPALPSCSAHSRIIGISAMQGLHQVAHTFTHVQPDSITGAAPPSSSGQAKAAPPRESQKASGSAALRSGATGTSTRLGATLGLAPVSEGGQANNNSESSIMSPVLRACSRSKPRTPNDSARPVGR